MLILDRRRMIHTYKIEQYLCIYIYIYQKEGDYGFIDPSALLKKMADNDTSTEKCEEHTQRDNGGGAQIRR